MLLNIEYIYLIKRSKKAKYIRLKVNGKGNIELIIPKRVTLKEGIKFLESKREWLKLKVEKSKKQKQQFRYLGMEISLEHREQLKDNSVSMKLEGNKLLLQSAGQSIKDERELFENWLQKRAEEYIPKRVKELSTKYGFTWKSVKIKKLTSRWGSCSSKRNLSFNYKLMYFNAKIIDYVIFHELCHLVEMNHSQKFWHLVKSYVPNHRALRKQLNFTS